jgi:hypothetical protein
MSALTDLLKSPMWQLLQRLNRAGAEREVKRLITQLAGEGSTDHDIEVLVFANLKIEPVEYRKMDVFQRRDWLRAIKDSESEKESSRPDSLSKEAKALAALVAHPEWSDAKIAKHVDCARTTLYRWPKFVAAREALKTSKSRFHRADEM